MTLLRSRFVSGRFLSLLGPNLLTGGGDRGYRRRVASCGPIGRIPSTSPAIWIDGYSCDPPAVGIGVIGAGMRPIGCATATIGCGRWGRSFRARDLCFFHAATIWPQKHRTTHRAAWFHTPTPRPFGRSKRKQHAIPRYYSGDVEKLFPPPAHPTHF